MPVPSLGAARLWTEDQDMSGPDGMLSAMAVCQECQREMLTASSCAVSTLHIAGDAIPVVPHSRDGATACPRCRRQGDGEEDPEPSSLGLSTENPCPRCGSTAAIPILYGVPNPALSALSEQGHVELAGCVFAGQRPSSRCRDCHHAWSRQGSGVLNHPTR